MPYIEVNVDLDEFDDEDLIEEIEGRGWWVSDEKGWEPEEVLTDSEKDWICEIILGLYMEDDLIGREIYDKLRKR